MALKGRPEPAPGLLRRLDALGRNASPVVAAAALMVLAAAPVGPPGVVAAIALPCVFFWSVFRPAVMPPPAVFAIGLLQDLLTFTPVGVGVLTLLVTHGLATRWRRMLARQSFLVVWLAYIGFALGCAALALLFQAVLGWRLPPLAPGLHQVALSAGMYPVLAYAMTRAHRAMARAEAMP